MSDTSAGDTERTVEVCQQCGAEYDDLLDVVLNAEHTGPFHQEAGSAEPGSDQDD